MNRTTKKSGNEDFQLAMRVSVNSIIVNLVLSVFKLFAGVFAKSGAMVSDAVHSASDVFSTFIVMFGVSVARKESDAEHQYGHERMECVASIVLATVLLATGLGIGISGIEKIFSGNSEKLSKPGVLALIAAITSIVVKEGMYWYTRHAAKKINSGALMADAWHHRSDALSSVGSFIGIFGARLGVPILDPIASVAICIFIAKASFDIFRDAMDKMVDRSCSIETIERIRRKVLEQKGVLGLDDIKSRIFGSKVYIDIEIQADGRQSLYEAHKIAETVHSVVESSFPEVKHCMVHVNPVAKQKKKENENN